MKLVAAAIVGFVAGAVTGLLLIDRLLHGRGVEVRSHFDEPGGGWQS